MHDNEVKFEQLSEQDIAGACRLYKESHIHVILLHLFDKQIDEHRKKFDSLDEDDFKSHQACLVKMKDLRGTLQLERIPKPIR